ncbi:Protein slit, partial [Gryllus bimaculatus]
MPRRRALALLLAVVALAAHGLATSSSCPTVCNCKWKGGKQTVECVNRGLITVPTNVHPETQVLDMSGNNLQILPRDLFVRAGLLNLQKVYLRRCRIGEIDDHAFRGLTNLVEMDLSNNLLTSVPSTTFSDIQFLREVVLANNPIQKIENNAFSNLPNLVKLDLSNCEIQSISSQAFESVDQLASLKLNGNRITELKQKTVDSLSRLHGIELHDNPWHCDCRLRATKLWLTHSNTPYTAAPRCHGGPARVAGRSVAE